MQDRLPKRVTLSKIQARRHYDRLSVWYGLLPQPWERRVANEGLALLAPRFGEHLLEIGPGSGWALLRMAVQVGPSGKLSGLDISPGMLAATRRRMFKSDMAERVRLRLGDATRLPYADHQFDGVFMSFVLEALDTPGIPDALAEVGRTLKPGGRLVVVALSCKQDGPFLRLYEWGHEHCANLLNARPIHAAGAIREAGFDVESIRLTRIWGLPVEMVLAKAPPSRPGS
jgi:demethylmenaquinone methyltransferase/2-methoxy-6-polyprenyl-1,4-benzoquinol methylase